jgi:FMN phosphatase YigB (HAD superfamily)
MYDSRYDPGHEGIDVTQLQRRAFIPADPVASLSIASKPLIFIDFHGTLSTGTFWNTLPAEPLATIQQEIFENEVFLRDWMRGGLNCHDACRYAAHLTGLSEEYLQFELFRSCTKFSVDPSILDLIVELRSSFRTVLITANMDCFKIVIKNLNLYSVFDEIINSADYGLLKEDNHGLLFEKVANGFASSLQEAILIDDSASVCDIFSGLGGRSVQVFNQTDVIHALYDLKIMARS